MINNHLTMFKFICDLDPWLNLDRAVGFGSHLQKAGETNRLGVRIPSGPIWTFKIIILCYYAIILW